MKTTIRRLILSTVVFAFVILPLLWHRDVAHADTPPPTLFGEVAEYTPAPISFQFTQVGTVPCTSYSFQVTTTASGPYQGRFSASGTFTLEPMTPDPVTGINYRVTSWDETFRIDQPVSTLPPQPVAHVVTGSKQLDPTRNGPGINVAKCSDNLVNPSPVQTTYNATINGSDGTFNDHGTAGTGIGAPQPFDPANATFFENFTSAQTATTPAACDPPPANMISWWPGEGDTTDIVGGNTGSWRGTAAYSPGKVGSAFNFDGSSWVSVPAASGSLDITGSQVTLDGWVNPSVAGRDAIYFGKTAYGFNDYVIFTDFESPDHTVPGTLVAIVKTCAGFATCEHLFGTGYVVPANQWTHIALTYDGSIATIYVNGLVMGSTPISGNISGEGSEFAIGGRQSDPFVAHKMLGQIDEVEVFDRALTQSEIFGIYNAGSAGKCKPGNDTTPPDTTITSGPTDGSTTNTSTGSFTFTGTDNATTVANLTFECQLDGGVFTACASPKNYSGLPDGQHVFAVRAIDQAGNVDPTPATRTWTVDTTPPDTVIDTHPSNPSNQSSATFTYHSSEPNSTFQCKLDSGAYSSCPSSGQTYTGLADGTHTFSVYATDAAGNSDPTPATFTWTVITAPLVSFAISNASAVVGRSVNFWGDQWAKNNPLLSGSAPSAFKGYATSTTASSLSCGGSWTFNSSPGNSSGPPASLPQLITVLVTDSVTKQGSGISGNVVGLAVIRVDPGYGPAPGRVGTGMVVSISCAGHSASATAATEPQTRQVESLEVILGSTGMSGSGL